MKIVGLHNGHDCGITVLENGKILYHWELERYVDRVKHFSGMHNKNIVVDFLRTTVLPTLGWRGKDIDAICLAGIYAGWEKHAGWIPNMWSETEFCDIVANNAYKHSFSKPYVSWKADWDGSNIDFHAITHHVNHMAYSYYTSPFDESAVFAYDGCGDFSTTTTMGIGRGNKLSYINNLSHEESWGIETNHIGYTFGLFGKVFDFFGDDSMAVPGKAMGLSSYGKVVDEWKDEIKAAIRHNKIAEIGDKLKIPSSTDSRSPLAQDFMATVQDVAEEYVLGAVSKTMQQTNMKNLCLSGGCALNVQINSRIRSEITQNLHVPPACSDVGQSIGASLYCWHHIMDNKFVPMNWHNPYIGMNVSNTEFFDHYKVYFPEISMTKFSNEDEMIDCVSSILAEDNIVGWAQGRTEIGPRALGNRSILASPCSPSMKDQINFKVKHREWWRPFAPVCLAEDASDWFEVNCDLPYMLEAPNVKTNKHHLVPAIVHVDGTARLQTIRSYQNPILHKLISNFKKRTGIPMLLNTSLNGKAKPIANNTRSILQLLHDTSLDCVVIGNCLFKKKLLKVI